MRHLTFTLFMIVLFGFIACNNENQNGGNELETPILDKVFNYVDLKLPSPIDQSIITQHTNSIDNPFGFPFVINSTSNSGIMNGGIPVDPKFAVGNFVNITNDGATLGRVLFYDKKLSLNNAVSCASCHHQDKAFTDGEAFSKGFEGKITDRSSMAILNPITQNNLFWDSRSKSIHDLSLRPIINHIEMGMENLDYLEKKLSKETYYPELFKKAYGTDEITRDKISDALSQFIASITSSDSKFDKVMRGESSFTQLEKVGLQIFFSNKAQCSSCHAGSNFAAPDGMNDPYGGGQGLIVFDSNGFANFSEGKDLGGAANIGLDVYPKDKGRDNGSFKIPSLRNIALTAPYMHDGRFKSLEEVVDHYSAGMKDHPQLDVKFREANGEVKRLNLSGAEKKALISFLNTLTDDTFISDPKYSNPFMK